MVTDLSLAWLYTIGFYISLVSTHSSCSSLPGHVHLQAVPQVHPKTCASVRPASAEESRTFSSKRHDVGSPGSTPSTAPRMLSSAPGSRAMLRSGPWSALHCLRRQKETRWLAASTVSVDWKVLGACPQPCQTRTGTLSYSAHRRSISVLSRLKVCDLPHEPDSKNGLAGLGDETSPYD